MRYCPLETLVVYSHSEPNSLKYEKNIIEHLRDFDFTLNYINVLLTHNFLAVAVEILTQAKQKFACMVKVYLTLLLIYYV